MRLHFRLLLLALIVAFTCYAQDDKSFSLEIGDQAPPLGLKEWIKGTPVKSFEKGYVYVVEFWATWCQPCIVLMPHLSGLARKHKNKVIFLGINVMEKKTTSVERVKAFVDSMGSRMDYNVAVDDRDFMVANWFNASGEQGIPTSFVVNAQGMLAWIGHPKYLDEVLYKIVSNNWDLNAALNQRKAFNRLAKLDDSLKSVLNKYVGDPFKPGDLGKPDSALLLINELIQKEPQLKYAPYVAFHTFSSLLKTDSHKAYEFGQQVFLTTTYEDPPFQLIIDAINWYSDKLSIPGEIYELGAIAYQAKIDRKEAYLDVAKNYSNMADMYWRAKNKFKAIEAMQKAIDELKSDDNFNSAELSALESLLLKYKKM